MALNKVMLIGNLGTEPDIRTTQGGDQIATLKLATSYGDKTQWHTIKIFHKKLVESVAELFHTGHQVYVEGRIETRKFTDRAGKDQWWTEIIADQAFLLGPKDANLQIGRDFERTDYDRPNIEEDPF